MKIGDLIRFRTYIVIPSDLQETLGLVVEIHDDMPVPGLMHVTVLTQFGPRKVYLPPGIERIQVG